MNMTFIFNRTIKTVALLLSVLITQGAWAKDTPGATQTSYGVSAAGAFQYSIPIVVPQGRNGVTPNLAISFSSGGGNGPLGVGWGLSGLSAITRCGKTFATNGERGGVTHGDEDQFCMGGQQLIEVPGTGTIKYRTEIDSFAKIEAIGNGSIDVNGGRSPSGWRVWAKDGSIYYYGSTNNTARSAQFKLPGTNSIHSWNLYEMQDRYGNLYRATYRTNDGLPSKIEYTFVSGVAKQEILFSYETRPDQRSAYVLGSKIDRNVRLKRIRVRNNGSNLREYNLAYQQAPVSELSRLSSVTECGLNNSCMGPITIQWKNDVKGLVSTSESGLKAAESTFNFSTSSDNLNMEITKGTWADVNGDGRVDQIIAYRGPTGGAVLKTYLQKRNTNGSRSWQLDTGYKLPHVLRDYSRSYLDASFLSGSVINQGQLVDVNGDGLVDIVYAVKHDWWDRTNLVRKTRTLQETWINTGSGWKERPTYKLPDIIYSHVDNSGQRTNPTTENPYESFIETMRGRFVDINGDGLVDWVRAYHVWNVGNKIATWTNDGTKFVRNATYDLPDVFAEYRGEWSLRHGELVDVNGDGRPDWVRSYHKNSDQKYAATWLNTTDGFVPAPSNYVLPNVLYENISGWDTPRARGSFIDVNGDGRRDFVLDSELGLSYQQGLYGSSNKTWLNTGRGWQYTSGYNVPFLHKNHRYIGHTGQSGNQAGANWPLNTNGIYIDMNRDGLVDFAQSYKDVFDVVQEKTWINTGAGWAEDSSFNTGQLFYDYSGRDTSKIRFGDFIDINSDGAPDWVRSRAGSSHITKLSRIGKSDQLESITTTLGVQIKPTFKPLTDNPSLYVKEPNSFFDNQPLQAANDSYFITGPMYVTSELSTSDAIDDDVNTVRFKYAGAQVNRLGRGFLGFHTRTAIQLDDRDPIMAGTQYTQTTTGYHQGFPLTGRSKRTKVWAQGTPISTVVLNENTTTYQHQARSNGTHFVGVDRTTSFAYELNDRGRVRKVIRDLDYNTTYGNVEKDTTWVYSNTNQLLRKSVSDPSYFPANESRWHIGQVSRVTSRVEDGTGVEPPELNRVDFAYYDNFKGDLYTVSREPTNPDLSARLFTAYEYDTYGNVKQQNVQAYGNNSTSRITKIGYEASHFGRLPTRLENALGHVSAISYHPSCDAPSSITDANGLTATISYDNFCRETRVTDVTGIVSETLYDDANLSCFNCQSTPKFKVTTTSPDSADISTYLNHFGLPMLSTTQGMQGGAEIIEQKTDYDTFGRTVRESQPYFVGDERHWNYYSYDQLGRVTQTDLPYTTEAGNPAVVSYSYATDGELIKRSGVDAEGRPTTSYADALGQIKSIKDAHNESIYYTYYADGALKTTNTKGIITTVEYDDIGRRTKLIDPDLGTSTYAYNGHGELTAQTDNKGKTITMAYDKLSRLTSRTIPTVAGDPTASGGTSTWGYDTATKGIGAIASVTGPNGYSQSFNYDNFGRSLSSSTTINGITMTESVSYDPNNGFLAGRNYPESGAGNAFGVQYEYQNGYLATITSTPDQAGDCTEHWRANKYDALGRTELETLGKLVTTKRSFKPGQNVLNKIESIIQQGAGANSLVQNLSYTYDGVNNLKTRVDGLTNLDERFEYDNLDRLTKHYQDNVLKTEVSYNAIGNILTKSDVGTYSYGANGAGPHAVTSITPVTSPDVSQFEVNWEWNGQDEIKEVPSYAAGQAAPYAGVFDYDANGSATKIGNRNVYWTAFDKPYQMLVTQTDGSQKGSLIYYGPHQERIYKEEASYSYDGNNGTFLKQTITEKTLYLGKDYERIEKKDENGNWQTVHRYTIATGGNAIQIERKDGTGFDEPKYLLGDNLGSTNVILNALGEVEQRLAFDPWGMRMDVPGSNVAVNKITNRGYTGHEMDDEVGLINMNARIYDPYLGRFLSADPVLPDAGDMQQFNRYSYVMNNPLKYTDPTGNQSESLEPPAVPPDGTIEEGTPAICPTMGAPVCPSGTPPTPEIDEHAQSPRLNGPFSGQDGPLGRTPLFDGFGPDISLLGLITAGLAEGAISDGGTPGKCASCVAYDRQERLLDIYANYQDFGPSGRPAPVSSGGSPPPRPPAAAPLQGANSPVTDPAGSGSSGGTRRYPQSSFWENPGTYLPSVPQVIVDSIAGFGDSLSFNITKHVRDLNDIGSVDTTSVSYNGGKTTGTVFGLFNAGRAGLQVYRGINRAKKWRSNSQTSRATRARRIAAAGSYRPSAADATLTLIGGSGVDSYMSIILDKN